MRISFAWCAAVCGALWCAGAFADRVWVIGAGGAEKEIAEIRVGGISDGMISFQTSKGQQVRREIGQVARLELDDEPALAAAESAYAQHHRDNAATGYRKALEGTRQSWVKGWIAPRLIESGDNARQLAASVAGYIALVQTNVQRAENYPPALPEGDAEALAAAARDVSAALSDANWTPAQRQCLLSFLLDVQRARKDQKATDEILDQMLKSGDAAAARAVVRKRLDAISQLLERQEYRQAKDQIDRGRQVFVEPRDQAEALYYIAEASAGEAADGKSNDTWKDTALAYMRVVAHFKDAPGTPFVAASLLKTAAIEERLNNSSSARRLYEQVMGQFVGTPAAESARVSLARLGQK